jgi:biotin carboxylase
MVGFTPYELEIIFLAGKYKESFVCFAAKNSSEDRWAKKSLKNKIVNYETNRGLIMEASEYDEIFSQSDIIKVIKKSGVKKLWLTTNLDNLKFFSAVERKYKFKIINAQLELQKKIENKIWFDSFLKKNNLPKPESQVLKNWHDQIEIKGKLIIQKEFSAGSDGTFLIKNAEELKKFFKKIDREMSGHYLIRKYISGEPLGITALVSAQKIFLSLPRIQCYDNKQSFGHNSFLGLQWLPTKKINAEARNNIDLAITDAGKKLAEIGFKGLANFDFMLSTDNKVFLIECNPRLSAATPQIFKIPAMLGIKNSEEIFKIYLDSSKEKSKTVICQKIPSYNFSGSFLSLKSPAEAKIKNAPESGAYRIKNGRIKFLTADITRSHGADEFIFMSFAEKGQGFKANDDYGKIYSDFPLFDDQGKINKVGKKIINYFQKLCW